MGSTLVKLQVHFIFGTKEFQPWISKSWRDELHAYMGGCVREIDAFPIEIGGVENHAHMLVGLRATHCLSDVMREVKASSSRWVHDVVGVRRFAWQEGYAGYSVSVGAVSRVRAYIRNQEEHHRRRTFKDEYLAFLRKHDVPFDPRYVFR